MSDIDTTVRRARRQMLSAIPVRQYGKYCLIGKLGHGGMAEVFLAHLRGPADVSKLVVIKRLHRHLQDDEEHVQMFLDEARLSARLSHPNVVQTYELGEIDGSHFMALEYLEGQSFERIYRVHSRGDHLPFPLVALLFRDLLRGFQYAHDLEDFDGTPLGIVHRDVSPNNLFVTYGGEAKLLDFGVAKAATHLTVTESGTLKGKCSYVAPEHAHGEELDQRADLWGVGVILWETLVGRRLFKSSNDAATLTKVFSAKVVSPRELNPEVPEPLAQITLRALERNRERRYQSASDMGAELNEYIDDVGRMGREELASYLRHAFSETIERHRQVLKIALADVSIEEMKKRRLTPPLGTKAARQSQPEVAVVPVRDRPPPRPLAVAIIVVLLLLVVGIGGLGILAYRRADVRALSPAVEVPAVTVPASEPATSKLPFDPPPEEEPSPPPGTVDEPAPVSEQVPATPPPSLPSKALQSTGSEPSEEIVAPDPPALRQLTVDDEGPRVPLVD